MCSIVYGSQNIFYRKYVEFSRYSVVLWLAQSNCYGHTARNLNFRYFALTQVLETRDVLELERRDIVTLDVIAEFDLNLDVNCAPA